MNLLSDILRGLVLAAFLAGTSLTLTACNEGPMEEAGEEMDSAAEDVGDAVD